MADYVIRRTGALHLRIAAADLYWHQYLLRDVFLVLATGVLLVTVIALFYSQNNLLGALKIGQVNLRKQNLQYYFALIYFFNTFSPYLATESI
jgi:hypothetical protein